MRIGLPSSKTPYKKRESIDPGELGVNWGTTPYISGVRRKEYVQEFFL